ncbi:uncharacterized protein [Montipora foliosa]|uniref:uncharacterized protein n=1 Tax=Montipora foliosa TaxID=591990 RepID=UPI0035F1F40E
MVDPADAGTGESGATGTSTIGERQLPSGIAMPKALRTDGNLATNWKKFKRAWDNYAIVARINQFEEEFQTAAFLSAISEDGLELLDGMNFDPEDDRKKLDAVITKFEELCIGETNETYKRYIFNRRNQEEGESIDKYVNVLRTLAQSCNFCSCLHDSLVHDRLVLGIRNSGTRKKLLQEKKLTLSRAIDICKSSEATSQQMKTIRQLIEREIQQNPF